MSPERRIIDLEEELKQYRKFAFDRNMVGVAVALILATTCQKVVNGISDHLLMPIVNFCVTEASTQAGTDWREWKIAVTPGLDIEIGLLASNFLEFTITTVVLYLIYFKVIKFIAPHIISDEPDEKDRVEEDSQQKE